VVEVVGEERESWSRNRNRHRGGITLTSKQNRGSCGCGIAAHIEGESVSLICAMGPQFSAVNRELYKHGQDGRRRLMTPHSEMESTESYRHLEYMYSSIIGYTSP
jgi:hypothetical protein